MNSPVETVPEELTLLVLNKVVHLHFWSLGNKYVIVLKDKERGWSTAKITKNQPMHSVTRFLIDNFHTFGSVPKVVTDGGPCFGDSFSELLQGWDIEHRYTSAY